MLSKQIRRINFQAYGVKISVGTNEGAARLVQIESCVAQSLPYGFDVIAENEIGHFIETRHGENGHFQIIKDGERAASGAGDKDFFDKLNSQIRLTIGEYAVGKVFLHAGVVGWAGRAIVIPAKSFAGKTTLVAELLKRGAVYYSDEYAVLDGEGFVEPFAKPLSMRQEIGRDERAQIEVAAERFGGVTGDLPLPVKLILICRFVKEAAGANDKIALEILSRGNGILEMLAHAIPARRAPKFTLEVLNKVASRAIIAKCQRGEAGEFAEFLIDFIERVP